MIVNHIIFLLSLISLGINKDRSIKKLAKSSKIHWNLIIKPHQLGWGIKIRRVNAFIKYFDGPLHHFAINVHGIFIKPIIEIISQVFVLGLPIHRLIQIKFVERMSKYVLRLYYIHWRFHDSYNIKYKPLRIYVFINFISYQVNISREAFQYIFLSLNYFKD
jgi:hypothetical protein